MVDRYQMKILRSIRDGKVELGGWCAPDYSEEDLARIRKLSSTGLVKTNYERGRWWVTLTSAGAAEVSR